MPKHFRADRNSGCRREAATVLAVLDGCAARRCSSRHDRDAEVSCLGVEGMLVGLVLIGEQMALTDAADHIAQHSADDDELDGST